MMIQEVGFDAEERKSTKQEVSASQQTQRRTYV